MLDGSRAEVATAESDLSREPATRREHRLGGLTPTDTTLRKPPMTQGHIGEGVGGSKQGQAQAHAPTLPQGIDRRGEDADSRTRAWPDRGGACSTAAGIRETPPYAAIICPAGWGFAASGHAAHGGGGSSSGNGARGRRWVCGGNGRSPIGTPAGWWGGVW